MSLARERGGGQSPGGVTWRGRVAGHLRRSRLNLTFLPPRRQAAAFVAALSIVTALPSAAPAAADGQARLTSKTTLAGTVVSPLLDGQWRKVRRHRAHLDVTGRNVAGAESTVTASVRILARRGSNTAWCIHRVYSYRPIPRTTAGSISIKGIVVHSDGSRDRSNTLVAPYSGDEASVGKVSGVTSFSQLTVRPLRADDVVIFRVEINLGSQVEDLQESVDLTAC